MNVAILHGWRLEGMPVGAAGRRSIAREKPEGAAGCLARRVIVDDHREQSSVDRLLLQKSKGRLA